MVWLSSKWRQKPARSASSGEGMHFIESPSAHLWYNFQACPCPEREQIRSANYKFKTQLFSNDSEISMFTWANHLQYVNLQIYPYFTYDVSCGTLHYATVRLQWMDVNSKTYAKLLLMSCAFALTKTLASTQCRFMFILLWVFPRYMIK